MKGLGKGVKSFKDGVNEAKEEINKAKDDIEEPASKINELHKLRASYKLQVAARLCRMALVACNL